MAHDRSVVTKLARLDDESRFEQLDPERMWDALGRPVPHAIVDIGAGSGLFARRFASMAPAARVFAVDTDPEAIRWMRSHEDPALGGRVQPLLAQESGIPLPTGAADLVVMINLHHELQDAPAGYAEARRLLRPGGQLLVVDWAATDAPGGPPMEIRATADQIAAVLSAAGFADVSQHGGLPRHSMVTARTV